MNTPLTETTKQVDILVDDYMFSYTNGITPEYSTVSTELLAKEFYRNGKVELGILPPVVRYISEDFLGCIIERPPHPITIHMKFGDSYSKKEPEAFVVNLPWTTYVIKTALHNRKINPVWMKLFFRNSQIWTEDDNLYVPPLPNMYNDGTICYGTMKLDSQKFTTLSDAANFAISSYWGAVFNNDLRDFYQNSCPAYIRAKVKKEGKTLGPKSYMRILSSLTTDEMLEIEYVHKNMTVKRAMKDLESNTSSSEGKSLLQYLTPIINGAKSRE